MAKNKEKPILSKAQLTAKYKSSTNILFIFVALTAINIISFLLGSDNFWVCSATVPWATVVFSSGFESQPVLIAGIILATIMILGYLAFAFLGKKNFGWVVVSLVFVIIDTIALIALYVWIGDFSGILDFLGHVYIIYYLAVAVNNGRKLKDAPEFIEGLLVKEEPLEESTYIRFADSEAKYKKWLEVEFENKSIDLRKVGKNLELVIDGYVYAETTLSTGQDTVLSAVVGGRLFEAGMTVKPYTYFILADRCPIAMK
ncbi:MAG: hypothetical protein IJ424_06740 [Oscillospiraceae bacterium]|nr:hypothetical protein [Oscillospiraceae bacterium]